MYVGGYEIHLSCTMSTLLIMIMIKVNCSVLVIVLLVYFKKIVSIYVEFKIRILHACGKCI